VGSKREEGREVEVEGEKSGRVEGERERGKQQNQKHRMFRGGRGDRAQAG
jgi:hypothetical protein